MTELPDYGPIDDSEIQTPFPLVRFEADHESYGPVSGVTCDEWPMMTRFCFFYRDDKNLVRVRFTNGETFVGAVTTLDRG